MNVKKLLIVGGVMVGMNLYSDIGYMGWRQTAFAASPEIASSPPGAPAGAPAGPTAVEIDPLAPKAPPPANRSKRMKGANKNPIVTANSSAEHDPELVAWLQAWANAPHAEATPDELAQLAPILAKTSLKAPALFDIAHGFHSTYVAPLASLALYNAAANHAHQILIQKPPSLDATIDILFAMERNRADLRKVMGSLVDPHGDSPQDFETLKNVYSDVAQFTPASGSPGYDPDLDAGGQAAMSGLAQYYTSTGQYDDANKLLESASKKEVAPTRRATLEWNWAENSLLPGTITMPPSIYAVCWMIRKRCRPPCSGPAISSPLPKPTRKKTPILPSTNGSANFIPPTNRPQTFGKSPLNQSPLANPLGRPLMRIGSSIRLSVIALLYCCAASLYADETSDALNAVLQRTQALSNITVEYTSHYETLGNPPGFRHNSPTSTSTKKQ